MRLEPANDGFFSLADKQAANPHRVNKAHAGLLQSQRDVVQQPPDAFTSK